MSQPDIERLRALEKKIRGRVPSDDEYVMLSNFERGSVSARKNIADELATLIAELGQEVGAVADSELPGMWSASDFTGGDPDERCHAERVPVAAQESFTTWFCLNYPGPHTIISDPNWHAPRIFRQAQWAIKQSSPAHTSEARDAARLDWLESNGCDHLWRKSDNAPAERWYDSRTSVEAGSDRFPTLRAAIDAAMRQEGGND